MSDSRSRPCGSDGVSEADVDLDGNARAVKAGGERYAHAFVIGVFGDSFGLDRVCVEYEAIRFDFQFAEFPKQANKPFGRIIATTKKIGIARRAVRVMGPEFEEQCAFQDECIVERVRRYRIRSRPYLTRIRPKSSWRARARSLSFWRIDAGRFFGERSLT
jgi:hypothetical protein